MLDISSTSITDVKRITPRRFSDARGWFFESWSQPKVAAAVLDVAMDIRVGSPTYLKSAAVELSAESGAQLLVPRGFLHGFLTMTDDAEALYSAEGDGAVWFDDPDLSVARGLGPGEAILSDKGAAAAFFADFDSPFIYEAAT